MPTTSGQVSREHRSVGVSAACLVMGALFGLLSVYSDSRASCALWVVIALLFTFVAGLLFQPPRRTR